MCFVIGLSFSDTSLQSDVTCITFRKLSIGVCPCIDIMTPGVGVNLANFLCSVIFPVLQNYQPGGRLNIKKSSYQERDPPC